MITNDKIVVSYFYFDNSPRCECCMNSLFDDDYKGCPQPENYKAHGAIEWLRFVWNMNKNLKDYKAPADFDWDRSNPERDIYGELGGFGSPLALFGTNAKPANIPDKVKGEIWRGVEVYENYTIYTNALTGRCLIELYNPDLEELFDSAYQMTMNEYVGESYPHKCRE